MKHSKSFFAIGLIVLFAADIAFAAPGFPQAAPSSSIESCVRQVAMQADYADAGRVRHAVETEERRVSGHTIRISTLVLDVDGTEVIREYASVCAINGRDEIKRFKIRRKGV